MKEKEKRLAEIDKTTATGGPAGKSRPDVKTLIKTHNKYRNAWRDRKTICRDALEIIADQMEKKMKSVVVSGIYSCIHIFIRRESLCMHSM